MAYRPPRSGRPHQHGRQRRDGPLDCQVGPLRSAGAGGRLNVNHKSLSSFIWTVADLLRGDYKQSDYGKVILPFTVLRRLDCVLEGTKEACSAEYKRRRRRGSNPEPYMRRKTTQSRSTTPRLSKLTCESSRATRTCVGTTFTAYVQGFAPNAQQRHQAVHFATQIDRLRRVRAPLPGRRRASPRSISTRKGHDRADGVRLLRGA